MSTKGAVKLFEALDSLARKYRHAVHSEVCTCKACRELLRGIVVCEDGFAREIAESPQNPETGAKP